MPSLKYLIAACFCLSLGVFLPLPALANDVIFPGGGGVGLKPPDGMTILKGPHGFEDSKEDAVILIEEFDVAIYAPRASDFTAETWKDAATLEQSARPLKLPGGKEALLAVFVKTEGDTDYRYWAMISRNAKMAAVVLAWAPAASGKYLETEMIKALRSIRYRPRHSLWKKRKEGPFILGSRAGFFAVQTQDVNKVIMVNWPEAGQDQTEQPTITIEFTGYKNAPTNIKNERQRVQLALKSVHDLDFGDIMIASTESEQDGDVVISASGSDSEGTKMTLEQITRFGRKGYVQTLCVFRPELDIVERCNEIGQSVMIKSNE